MTWSKQGNVIALLVIMVLFGAAVFFGSKTGLDPTIIEGFKMITFGAWNAALAVMQIPRGVRATESNGATNGGTNVEKK